MDNPDPESQEPNLEDSLLARSLHTNVADFAPPLLAQGRANSRETLYKLFCFWAASVWAALGIELQKMAS